MESGTSMILAIGESLAAVAPAGLVGAPMGPGVMGAYAGTIRSPDRVAEGERGFTLTSANHI